MRESALSATGVLGVPFAFDLIVKAWARHSLASGGPIAVFPGFNLSLVFNRGVSFGLFPAGSPTGLAAMLMLQAVLCLGIALYAWRARGHPIVWPLLLLLSGALANLVDRFMNGAVTDYLDFYFGASHWPAFNLADVWITVGVAALIGMEYVMKLSEKVTVKQDG